MSLTDFVFYDLRLGQFVPCILERGTIDKIKDPHGINKFYLKCKFDIARLPAFNLSRDQVYRYSTEINVINEVYPYGTTAEKLYADTVITNTSTTLTHKDDELKRYLTILTEVSADGLNVLEFLGLAEFLSYELLFSLCSAADRTFMLQCGTMILTEQPAVVLVPDMVRMIRTIFANVDLTSPQFRILTHPDTGVRTFKLFNIRKYSEFDYIPFPVIINVDYLNTNSNFIIL